MLMAVASTARDSDDASDSDRLVPLQWIWVRMMTLVCRPFEYNLYKLVLECCILDFIES